MQAPGIEIVDRCPTRIGEIRLQRRAVPARPGTVATEITIGGDMLMSTLATVTEEALATRAFAFHGEAAGLRVLVGGLGLGYTARAVLDCPRVAAVEVVDRFEPVLRWMRDGLVPLSGRINPDPRVELRRGDVYAELLAAGRGEWDLILIDVDHSPRETLDPASEPFYTWHGQRQAVEHLRPGGVLGVWSAYDDEAFLGVLAEVYAEARCERVAFSTELIEKGAEIEEFLFLARAIPDPSNA